jgi:hypothetical protein
MDMRGLTASLTQPREQVLDLGAFRILVLDPRIITLGAGGNIIVETASVNEEGAFRTIAPIPLNAVSAMIEVTTFLRFVRWRTDALVAGNPVALIDVMAKDG